MTTMQKHLLTTSALPRRNPRARRGVAMLLVLITLVVTTIVAGAVLTSRDNSTTIGTNAASTTSAQWAARAAAEFAVAALQTEIDCIAADGTIMTDFTLAGANVSVVATDLQGNPPDDEDTELLLTITATVNGIKTVSNKVVTVHPQESEDLADIVDPELSEFAGFSAQKISIEKGARLAMWPASPAALPSRMVKIGTASESLSDISIDAEASLGNVAIYVNSSASSTLKSLVESPMFVEGASLAVDLPAVPKRLPSAMKTLPVANSGNWSIDGIDVNGAAPGVYEDVDLKNGAKLLLDESVGQHFSFKRLQIHSESALLIKGSIAIHVREDVDIDEGMIRLFDDASSLSLFVSRDLKIDHTSNVDCQVSQYRDPRRIRIYGLGSIDGGDNKPKYEIKNASRMNASIHAPTAELTVDDTATFVGRATSSLIEIKTGGVFLFDPALDSMQGFTTLDGPLYKEDGTPLDGLGEALDAFDVTAGTDALITFLVSSVTPDTSTPVDTGVTHRIASRAIGHELPTIAWKLERSTVGEENVVYLSESKSEGTIELTFVDKLSLDGIDDALDVSKVTEPIKSVDLNILQGLK